MTNKHAGSSFDEFIEESVAEEEAAREPETPLVALEEAEPVQVVVEAPRDLRIGILKSLVKQEAIRVSGTGLSCSDTTLRNRRLYVCIDCKSYPCGKTLVNRIANYGRKCPLGKW